MKFRNEAPCDDGYFAEDLRNKFPDEIKFALYYHVGTIIVDNFDELETINDLAKGRE